MSGERVLVVDDEPNIVDLCRLYLEREGFAVDQAGDGERALELATELQPDLIILDLMLPKLDGYEVCRRLQAEGSMPIIMLTARDDDVDKIVGLELGADDYVTKPFNPRELVARVKAILRRLDPQPIDRLQESLTVGDLQIDPARREVEVAGLQVELRPKEFDLLLAFAENPGIVLTRERLLDRVWGYQVHIQTRTVDVHVGHLRKHLAGSGTVSIETVTGLGYKLIAKG